ncbi:MAG: hypothetical protein ACJARP_000503 [Vicingaceae bacterium]|jgi:hypothetical protein
MNNQSENSKINGNEENGGLKEWESPQLFVENMQKATEGGTNPNPFEGDDGYYAS